MSYKTELQLNNAELEQILESILALPDAGSSGPVVEKDINFWDYDGTLLYSYTLDEMQALTELPLNAEHEGLIGEGWNWSLERLKENNGPLDVAALYVTEDGATWFDLENDYGRNVEVTFMWQQTSDNGATIDFGDGSEPYSTTATGDVTVSHIYEPGSYRAKISGEYSLVGSATTCCVNDIAAAGSSLLKRAFIGDITYIRAYSFKNCFRMETITLPDQLRLYGTQIFYQCRSLKFCYTSRLQANDTPVSGVFSDVSEATTVSFSETIVGSYTVPTFVRRPRFGKTFSLNKINFAANTLLCDVTITDATTQLASRAFQNCYSLRELTVPANVATINTYVFSGLSNLRILRFMGATPPSVTNTNAFGSFPTDCIVEVPAASLAQYQAATNYGTIAAQMVGV